MRTSDVTNIIMPPLLHNLRYLSSTATRVVLTDVMHSFSVQHQFHAFIAQPSKTIAETQWLDLIIIDV